MLAITSCYQVHTQNADAHIPICGGALLVLVPLVDWCRNVAAVNCMVHWKILTLPTLHMVLHL